MPDNKERKPKKTKRTPIKLTKYTYDVLRRAGIKYEVGRGGKTTILGQGRPPKPVFPKARYKILRKLTY